MKEIVLTQGKVALVDDEDYEKLNRHKWCAAKDCKMYYAVRSSVRSKVNGKQKSFRMHHFVIGKPPQGYEVDHRDTNGLNNQKNNLRFVTTRQNQQNRKHLKGYSEYPGVCWHKRDKKWRAQMTLNGKKRWLGHFDTEIEAFNAYQKAVNEIGETVLI